MQTLLTPNLFSMMIFVVLIGNSVQSLANCEPIIDIEYDYRRQLGPVRDQGDSHLCFANAAADALTLFYGKRVGTLSVAIKYFENQRGFEYFFMNPFGTIMKTLGGGLARRALDAGRSNNLCRADQETAVVSNADIKALIEKHNRYRAIISPHRPGQAINDFVQSSQKLFPSLDIDQLASSITPFKTVQKTLGEWIDKECTMGSDKQGDGKLVGQSLFMGKDAALANINEALRNQAIPVIHIDISAFHGFNLPDFGIGTHVVTVVGKGTKENNSCYLLRNTLGADCDYHGRYRNRCFDGHIWVSENELQNMVTGSVYLKDTNAVGATDTASESVQN